MVMIWGFWVKRNQDEIHFMVVVIELGKVKKDQQKIVQLVGR